MNISESIKDISIKGKKGLHFIIASIIIWSAVLIIWILPIKDILTRNLLTFCVTTPLMPLAYIISKIIKADFSNKSNPLNKLGILFSCNQLLYLLIAMWVYRVVPDKMVMILAIIFGAHLFPFGWLYNSKAYLIMAIIISLTMMIVGIMYSAVIVSVIMIIFEIIFSIWLIFEIRTLKLES